MSEEPDHVEPNEEQIAESAKKRKITNALGGWNSGRVDPTMKGFYGIKINVGDEATLGWWDGISHFSVLGRNEKYASRGVFEWAGPVLLELEGNRIPAKERVKLATRTEAPVTPEMIARFANPKTLRLLHATMGMSTEICGELMDNLKKHLFYGKSIDEVNFMEEMGDCDWYMNLACDALHTTMAIIEVANIKKLAKRYGAKFSEDAALLRNLGAELEVLQENLVPKEHQEHGNKQSPPDAPGDMKNLV